MVNAVGFLHLEKGRIVQSPWCLAVPVALVDKNCAACVHLENQVSTHDVGGFKRMVNVVDFLHMEKGRIVQSPWCLAVPVAFVDTFFAACVHLENQMSNHSVGGLKKVVNVVGFLHKEKTWIVQIPCCLAVPVALVDKNCAACVCLENQMSNHGVGCLKKMNVVLFLHMKTKGLSTIRGAWLYR